MDIFATDDPVVMTTCALCNGNASEGSAFCDGCLQWARGETEERPHPPKVAKTYYGFRWVAPS